MEEKKTNELTDEKLDEVTGGDNEFFLHPSLLLYCSHCNHRERVKISLTDNLLYCYKCGNLIE